MQEPPTPPPLPTEQLTDFQVEKKSWQFSLRTMMLGMTGFAALCGVLTIVPGGLFFLLVGLAWYVASGILATGLVFARGDQRAFCIGASVVCFSVWTGTGGDFLGVFVDVIEVLARGVGLPGMPIFVEAGLKYALLIALAIANGYLCIRARRYFERNADG